MTITKYGHSCVLVETAERTALFDPGVWSEIEVETLPDNLNRLVITHSHADHMDVEFIKQLVQRFESLHIVCNQAVQSELERSGIRAHFRGKETQCTKPFAAPHEQLPIPGSAPPDNTGYHFQNMFTHPGDSHSFSESKDILALPVIAPWGSTGRAVELALELKPRYVVPIHDWHYTNEARQWLYGLLEKAFAGSGIEVICKTNGESVDI